MYVNTSLINTTHMRLLQTHLICNTVLRHLPVSHCSSSGWTSCPTGQWGGRITTAVLCSGIYVISTNAVVDDCHST